MEHIDSTSALAESCGRTPKVPTVSKKTKKKKPEDGKSQGKAEKTQKTERSPDQIRRANMAMLLKVSPYFPIDKLNRKKDEIEKRISDLYTELEKVDDINEYTISLGSEESNQLSTERTIDNSLSKSSGSPTNTTVKTIQKMTFQ